MPGGIGKVSERVLTASARRGRGIDVVTNANDIFFHLDARHAYYDSAGQLLYFVDAPGEPVRATILATFAGMQGEVKIEQLHLDRHGCFNGARRVRLIAGQAEAVLVALQLAGIAVTVAEESAR